MNNFASAIDFLLNIDKILAKKIVMMKKILVVFFAAIMLASCFGDDIQNSTQYNMVATFEYVGDYDVNEFFGSDSLFFDTKYGMGVMWNDIAFCHKLDKEMNFTGGFLMSCLKGKTYAEGYEPDPEVDIYRVNAPVDSSRTYAVFVDNKVEDMMPQHDVEFTVNAYGTCHVVGCYINIPLYVAYSAAKEFKEGDSLVLKAVGYLDGKVTGEVSMDLITCTDGKINMIQKWTMLSLTPLGDIQYVDFDVQSSNENVPEVFCMDNFGAKVNIAY